MWITTHLTPMIILIWSNDNMKTDIFWKIKMSEYAKAFGFFRKNLIEESGLEDEDMIFTHWLNLCENVCDCEGCREEEDCVVHITFDPDDE